MNLFFNTCTPAYRVGRIPVFFLFFSQKISKATFQSTRGLIVVVKCDRAAMVAEKIQTLPVLVEGEPLTATENIESECSRENLQNPRVRNRNFKLGQVIQRHSIFSNHNSRTIFLFFHIQDRFSRFLNKSTGMNPVSQHGYLDNTRKPRIW